jgi:hypothetical protein
VTEAARRIFELEGTPKNGLFLEFDVETDEFGTDDEAFRVFHYTGKRALYGIKRSRPNRFSIIARSYPALTEARATGRPVGCGSSVGATTKSDNRPSLANFRASATLRSTF